MNQWIQQQAEAWQRRRDQPTTPNKTYFPLANVEYQLARAAYSKPEERAEHLKAQGIEGWILEQLNKEEYFAMVHEGQLYSVHRGSVTAEDWTESDVGVALNKLNQTPRYKRAIQDSADAQRIAEQKPVEVGHSLGGSLAEHIALVNGTHSVVFNMGTSPLRNFTRIDRTQHKHFRVEGDPVSMFDPTAHKTIKDDTATQLTRVAVPALVGMQVPGIFGATLPFLVDAALFHPGGSFV